MIKWTKTEIILAILLAVCCILIPILIHVLYSVDFGVEFFYSTWSSGDILQYCGTIIASIGAIFGIYYTLKENRNSELSNTILNSKPYIRTSFSHLSYLWELESLEDNRHFICVMNRERNLCYNLKNSYSKDEFIDYYNEHDSNDYMIVCYDIENIGLGNAINFQLEMNTNEFFSNQVICKDEKIRIYFLIDKSRIGKIGSAFAFVFRYEDVINVNTYEQRDSVFITYDAVKDSFSWNCNFENNLSEPLNIRKIIYK